MNCTKFVIALFGSLFLLAFLFVPCTTTTSSLRTDPYSHVVIRTAYPRNVHIFLATYLATRFHPQKGQAMCVRSTQWGATMVIVIVLGIFDYAVFCRLLRRKPRTPERAGDDEGEAQRFS